MSTTPLRVHLACGNKILAGWVNVDSVQTQPDVVVHDLDKPLNFLKDDSVDYILMESALYFIKDINAFLLEIQRVLKVGGVFELKEPHFKNPSNKSIGYLRGFSWRGFQTYPYFYSPAKKLKIISNLLVVESRIFPFTLLNKVANLTPKFWERFCYCEAVSVKMQKTSYNNHGDDDVEKIRKKEAVI